MVSDTAYVAGRPDGTGNAGIVLSESLYLHFVQSHQFTIKHFSQEIGCPPAAQSVSQAKLLGLEMNPASVWTRCSGWCRRSVIRSSFAWREGALSSSRDAATAEGAPGARPGGTGDRGFGGRRSDAAGLDPRAPFSAERLLSN